MRKGLLLAATFTTALGWAATANADPILFDPDGAAGGAGASPITLLDLSPGNSITLGVTAFSAPGTPADILFQANMSVAKNNNDIVAANCLTSPGAAMDCFKFVAGLPGIVVDEIPAPSLEFRFNPGSATNFFNIYAGATPGDDLSGTNFTTGQLVLTGTWLNDPSFFATFAPNLQSGGPLDQFGANNYPGVNSVAGTGAFGGNLSVTFADPTYFPGLVLGSTLFVASSKETLPYTQANPTNCFSATGTPGSDCTQAGVPSVGAVNGISGPNTVLETDASFSFITPQQVPEPATMALFGLVLLGGGATLRRRRMNTGR